MGKYIVRRLLWAVVVVFCVSLITFLLAFAIPADPAKQIAGPHATPQVLAQIRHSLSLDRPLYYQYALYMWHIAHGNLGYSYINQLPVTQSILQRFPATVMIAVFGILPLIIIVIYSFLKAGDYGGVQWIPSVEAYVSFLFQRDIFDGTLV